jgi:hypothetical protein
MLLPHFHFLGRDTPLRILATDIELGPLGMAQLTESHEYVWRDSKRIPGDRLPFVALNRSQQFADSAGLDDRRVVGTHDRRKRAAQI